MRPLGSAKAANRHGEFGPNRPRNQPRQAKLLGNRVPQRSHMSEVYAINTADTRPTNQILDFVPSGK
jgi:hypothetical protein